MSPKDRYADADNPLNEDTQTGLGMVEGFQQTYRGKVEGIPDSGRVIERPVLIMSLRPHLAQPRRAIPLHVRGDWDGDPVDLPTLLANWHLLVEARIKAPLDLPTLVRGEGDGEDFDRLLAVDAQDVLHYVRLLKLASSIYRSGLDNAIHTHQGKIVKGERRWLAYHLLNLYSGEDYHLIRAVEDEKFDVWGQAEENSARDPLNAIGMARQLALLIMDMYEGDKEVAFYAIDDPILQGRCDREYYAQVANGNVYRVKRDLGQRLLDATGLKSMDMVRKYRALLTLPDALWEQADRQSWNEGQIRLYVDGAKAADRANEAHNEAVTGGDTVTTVTVSGDSRPESLKVGDWVKTPVGQVSQISEIVGRHAKLVGLGLRNLDALVRTDAPPALEAAIGGRVEPTASSGGLFNQPTPSRPQSPPVVRYTDEDEDGDTDPDESPAAPLNTESTAPILSDLSASDEAELRALGTRAAAVLKLLRPLVGEDEKRLKNVFTDLQSISRANLRDLAQTGEADPYFPKSLLEAEAQLAGLIQQRIADVVAGYLKYLDSLWREMQAEVERD